jgi:hypothetical protein
MLKFLNLSFWYKTMDSISLQLKYERMKIATEGKAQYNKTAHIKCSLMKAYYLMVQTKL